MNNSQVIIEITKLKLFDSKPMKFESGTIFYLHVALPDGIQIGEKFKFVDSLQLKFDEATNEVCAPCSLIAIAIENETCLASWFSEYEELDALLTPMDSSQVMYRELVLEAKIRLYRTQESTVDEPDHETQQSELIEKANSTLQFLYRKY